MMCWEEKARQGNNIYFIIHYT